MVFSGSIKEIQDLTVKLKVASYRCNRCQALQPAIKFSEDEIRPPLQCINFTNQTDPCNSKSFQLMKDRSTFIDRQVIILESFSTLHPQERKEMEIILYDDLVLKNLPPMYVGSEILVSGILEIINVAQNGITVYDQIKVMTNSLTVLNAIPKMEKAIATNTAMPDIR